MKTFYKKIKTHKVQKPLIIDVFKNRILKSPNIILDEEQIVPVIYRHSTHSHLCLLIFRNDLTLYFDPDQKKIHDIVKNFVEFKLERKNINQVKRISPNKEFDCGNTCIDFINNL